LWKNHIYAPV